MPLNQHNLERQRDLFPLPLAPESPSESSGKSRTVRRRLAGKVHVHNLANESIGGLNVSCGCQEPFLGKPTAAQARCVNRVVLAAQEFGAPPTNLSEAQALRDLCQAGAVYADSSKVASFSEDRVSYPPVGSTSVPARDLTSVAVSELLDDWESRMLRPVDEYERLVAETGAGNLFVDPKLARSKAR